LGYANIGGTIDILIENFPKCDKMIKKIVLITLIKRFKEQPLIFKSMLICAVKTIFAVL